MEADSAPRKAKGGRPRGDPSAVRTITIGVRVSSTEATLLCERAASMHMKPAQWLREAALSRRLPSPPVAAINREQYVELARLAANLNQLTRLANEGQRVTVADGLLERLLSETQRLRLALLGVQGERDDR
ncbi:plasmid mobilization relaxosome protein MobC [Duganella sp. FT134W]|uniref:Plasmid mobilization relaxosome protein MobC n=1 Tax=Duganella margarita TaxID=2692170 RepID=A0A7X4H560_9BURK|nr:plasmid mobilization relaxosome protein MobC [Duganella margarita]MYM75493.1 plasmid mobilization relaxosome protein MobC [Duganella margarita]